MQFYMYHRCSFTLTLYWGQLLNNRSFTESIEMEKEEKYQFRFLVFQYLIWCLYLALKELKFELRNEILHVPWMFLHLDFISRPVVNEQSWTENIEVEKEEKYQFRYVVLSISYDALLYQIWSKYIDYQHLLS